MRLYGKNSVLERLKADPKSIKGLTVEKGVDLGEIKGLADACKVSIKYLSRQDFYKLAKDVRSQGLIAEIDEFKYTYLEDILRLPQENLPVILFLDNLNDPQNLGSILRTAGCFGGFSVVLPRHDSVEVTEAVLRVAQGGENYTQVSKAANMTLAIEKAKARGYWIAGAVVRAGEDFTRAKLNFPLGIVIGSEGKGIRPGLMSHLDLRFTLPMKGAELSFNASVSAALFCYEAMRQRNAL